jgi:glycerol-3-phosphate dehydrogenase (NAD(P)+)
MISKATVIGTGAMGTVMAQVLAANGVHVALLGQREERVQELLLARENTRYLPGVHLASKVVPTVDARAALANSELVIAAVPCQYLRGALERMKEHLPNDAPICSVIKGIELGTGLRPSEILAEFAPQASVAVLSGPSIANELAKCLPATVVVACSDSAVATQLQDILTTSWFRIYTNSDVLGVELAGALKNVIALAAGILDGLHAGDNAKAALITRGLVEMTRLGVALGGKPETFAGLAGIGDLFTTCVSPHGRNRQAGERIGSGIPVEQVVRESVAVIEGIPTTKAALRLAESVNVEMPITHAVSRVLFEEAAPLAAITDLMRRPPKSEDLY